MTYSEFKDLALNTPIKLNIGKIVHFQADFKRSLRIQGKHHWSHLAFVLKAEDTITRLAVVASKKAIGKRAVLRNRAKRRIRPIMKNCVIEWNSRNFESETETYSLRWIIRPKKSAINADAQELEHDVRSTFEMLTAKQRKQSRAEFEKT